MDSFIRLVQDAQALQLNKNIANAAFDHAVILCEYLLKEAAEKGKDVRIITGELRNEFYNKLYNKAEAYLKDLKAKNKKIYIIIMSKKEQVEQELSSNKFAEFIVNDLKGEIKFYDRKDENCLHFFLVGDSSYRYETNHEKVKAVANFNNKDMGKILSMIFSDKQKKAA